MTGLVSCPEARCTDRYRMVRQALGSGAKMEGQNSHGCEARSELGWWEVGESRQSIDFQRWGCHEERIGMDWARRSGLVKVEWEKPMSCSKNTVS